MLALLIPAIALLAIGISVEVGIFLQEILSPNGLWDAQFTHGYPIWTFFIGLPYVLLAACFHRISKSGIPFTNKLAVIILCLMVQTFGEVISIFGIRDHSHTGFEILFFGMLIQYITTAVAWNRRNKVVALFLIGMIFVFFALVAAIDSGMSVLASVPILALCVALPYIYRRLVK